METIFIEPEEEEFLTLRESAHLITVISDFLIDRYALRRHVFLGLIAAEKNSKGIYLLKRSNVMKYAESFKGLNQKGGRPRGRKDEQKRKSGSGIYERAKNQLKTQ